MTVEAARMDAAKIGTALRREWMAYRLDGNLFVKRSRFPRDVPLVDLGASGQCFCNDAFIELETVGPLATVPPGGAVSHREVWEIHEVRSHVPLSRLAEDLSLDTPSPLLDVVT